MSGLTKAKAASQCKVTLENAGKTLVILGIVDLSAMAWAYWHGLDYDRMFGFVEIFIGALFLRQGLKTAKYVRLLALIVLPMVPLYGVLCLFLFPLDYAAISFRLSPGNWTTSFLHSGFYFVFLFWLQRILGREVIAYMQVERRITPFSTNRSLWVGAAFGIFLCGALYLALHSYYALKAVDMVEQKLGPRYKCFANSIHWDMGQRIVVGVVAYNSDSISDCTVRFKDTGGND